MLVEEFLPSGKFIVSASGLAGIGNSDGIKVHKIKNNLVMIGDLESDISKNSPLSPPALMPPQPNRQTLFLITLFQNKALLFFEIREVIFSEIKPSSSIIP